MKNLFNVTAVFVLAMVFLGCGSKNLRPQAESSGVDLSGKTVYIQGNTAKYAQNSRVANNIKTECKIDTQLITSIKKSATLNGMTLEVVDVIPAGGIALIVEITDAVSQGNAFIGHRKFSAISGSLTQNGQTIGSFAAARRSGGGVFGGFKGSCSVLARTVETLGSDVAKWMVRPTKGDALGDTGLIPR